ncbi:MAG: recombinase family protein [Desulfobacterales bacterium]|nr:recombinase family protein [Desulfobacterales bacterium]
MNDFLHNLRSIKDKQRFDRNRRQYNNPQYIGPDKRNGNDKRKGNPRKALVPENISELLIENLPVVKTFLETIAGHQQRLADAKESLVKAEERKTDALIKICEYLEKLIGSSVTLSESENTITPATASEQTPTLQKNKTTFKITEADREETLQRIYEMRKNEMSYEKIAQQLDSMGITTFSGKGKWRGQTVHKLCQQKIK